MSFIIKLLLVLLMISFSRGTQDENSYNNQLQSGDMKNQIECDLLDVNQSRQITYKQKQINNIGIQCKKEDIYEKKIQAKEEYSKLSENIIYNNSSNYISEKNQNTSIYVLVIIQSIIIVSLLIFLFKNKLKEQIVVNLANILPLQNTCQDIIQQKRQSKQLVYQVFWNKMISKVQNKICFNYTIYQGMFLNQEVHVYAVECRQINMQTIVKKLSKLLTCSHNRLANLYFYVKQSDFLLVFTQKIQPLSKLNLLQHFKNSAGLKLQKQLIIQLLQTFYFLQQKIQLKWLPLQSIQLQTYQNNSYFTYQFKINAIPCLFRIMSDNCSNFSNQANNSDIVPCFVRQNIASLFHIILYNGIKYNQFYLKQYLKNWQYKEFLQFILYEAKAIGHTHYLLYEQILEHPFLWDNQRKMFFLTDFSNYIQTHLDNSKIQKLQKYARQYKVVKLPWNKMFHYSFNTQINGYRKYDFESFRDLIRMIRNKINHFHQIPKQIKNHIGSTPEQFVLYCLTLYPKILYFSYNYTRKKKMKLHTK